MLSRYDPSLVSNIRDDMSRYVTGVADLLKEECHTAMLHNDMNSLGLGCMLNPLRFPSLVGFIENLGMDLMRKTNMGSRRRIQSKMNLGILKSNLRR